MTAPPVVPADVAAEVARLRAENASLNEQIKLLVQTEQRLYRSQNAREHELRRIRAVGAFALEVVGKPADTIHAHTLAVLRACFALDDAAVVHIDAAGRAETRALGPPRPASLTSAARTLLAATTTARVIAVAEGADLDDAAGAARELLRALGFQTTGVCALVPVAAGAVVVAHSPARKRPTYRDEALTEVHQPLLTLIGTHVQRVTEHAALTDDLQHRSQALAEVNQRLADSLQTLERTQAELISAGKLDAIGRLAGGVAHDFNNLLTAILGHATLAAEHLPAGSVAATELDGVLEAGKRAAEITSQLLALGRRTVQVRVHVDLGQVARELGRVLKGLLGRAIALDVAIEPDCGVFADRVQLQQVLLNLVINARDAMPDGGTVRVAVRTATAGDLEGVAPAARRPPMIALEVTDSGVGIDEATRTRIFEPFFTTKASSQDTGLGLSVVYGVVTQSEGSITVDSRPGHGTRFVVLLPRHAGPAAAPAVIAPVAPATATVLVVEDNEAIRRLATRILERAGYQVREASDGVAALALIADSPAAIDLMLTDLNMPRMGGLALAQRVRELRPALPVLFMTGYSEELAEVSRRAPSTACMTKPFTPEQLLDQVSQRLAAAAAAPGDDQKR